MGAQTITLKKKRADNFLAELRLKTGSLGDILMDENVVRIRKTPTGLYQIFFHEETAAKIAKEYEIQKDKFGRIYYIVAKDIKMYPR